MADTKANSPGRNCTRRSSTRPTAQRCCPRAGGIRTSRKKKLQHNHKCTTCPSATANKRGPWKQNPGTDRAVSILDDWDIGGKTCFLACHRLPPPNQHLSDASMQLHVPRRPNLVLSNCCKISGVKTSDKVDHSDKTGLRESSVTARSADVRAGSLW